MSTDRFSEIFLKKLVGRRDIEDALQKLDKLTLEEAQMVTAQFLNLARSFRNKLKDVDDKMDVVIKGIKGTAVLLTTR